MAHGHGGAGHGHASSSYNEEEVDDLKEQIGELEKKVRRGERAGDNVDALKDQLIDLRASLRRAERNDPLAARKRARDALKLEKEVLQLEHELKGLHPHEKLWVEKMGAGPALFVVSFVMGGVAALIAEYFYVPVTLIECTAGVFLLAVFVSVVESKSKKEGDGKEGKATSHH